jgi:hypothetical protein
MHKSNAIDVDVEQKIDQCNTNSTEHQIQDSTESSTANHHPHPKTQQSSFSFTKPQQAKHSS